MSRKILGIPEENGSIVPSSANTHTDVMPIYSPLKIRQVREAKGLNQSEPARAARVSPNTIWQYEGGHVKKPKYETLMMIAAGLGVPIEAILAAKQAPTMAQQLSTVFASLTSGRQAALLAAAKAFLEEQEDNAGKD